MIPLACGMGLCLSNCPTHKEHVYLFPHTHKKQKTKVVIKIFKKEKKKKEKQAGKKLNSKYIYIYEENQPRKTKGEIKLLL